MKESISKEVKANFRRLFKGEPLIVRSPGRVNIIGEHTDYNNGFVLPAAIDKAIFVAVGPRDDDKIALYSEDFKESIESSLTGLQRSDKGWPNYILGVADQLKKRSYKIGGFNLVIGGDVPIGSGLSSSAAVECATAFALNELFRLGISRMDIALIAQKAEHEFAGVMCGIMDQFASVFGKKDHVIKLDCLTLDYEYVPIKMEGIRIVLLNTNVKHSLGSSEYNTRRQQCEQGVEWVRTHYPQVESLRDVTMDMLKECVASKDKLIFKRCKYVVEENIRLQEGCEDLKRGDVAALGKKMFETHEGLSKEYEVSCKELDFLVEAVKNNKAVLGARMMGGGFGGCTINLVKEQAIEDLIDKLSVAYKENMKLDLTAYIAEIEDGTTLLEQYHK